MTLPNMTFPIDENLSYKVANALKALDRDVHHVTEVLGKGVSDEKILRELNRRGWFLITQDKRIRRRKHEVQAMLQEKVGAFIFMGQADKSLETMAMMILKHIGDMEKLARKTNRPFVFGISDRGKIERLDAAVDDRSGEG